MPDKEQELLPQEQTIKHVDPPPVIKPKAVNAVIFSAEGKPLKFMTGKPDQIAVNCTDGMVWKIVDREKYPTPRDVPNLSEYEEPPH